MPGGPWRDLVLVYQRADHARLVHRGQGPRRGVGAKEQALVRDRRLRRLDHHGHQVVALFLPAVEALESVEDLVAPVGNHGHSQRQISSLVGPRGQRARPQARVALAKARDRKVADRPRGLAERRAQVRLRLHGGDSTGHPSCSRRSDRVRALAATDARDQPGVDHRATSNSISCRKSRKSPSPSIRSLRRGGRRRPSTTSRL